MAVLSIIDLASSKRAAEAGVRILVHGVLESEVDNDYIQTLLKHKTFYCPTSVALEGYR